MSYVTRTSCFCAASFSACSSPASSCTGSLTRDLGPFGSHAEAFRFSVSLWKVCLCECLRIPEDHSRGGKKCVSGSSDIYTFSYASSIYLNEESLICSVTLHQHFSSVCLGIDGVEYLEVSNVHMRCSIFWQLYLWNTDRNYGRTESDRDSSPPSGYATHRNLVATASHTLAVSHSSPGPVRRHVGCQRCPIPRAHFLWRTCSIAWQDGIRVYSSGCLGMGPAAVLHACFQRRPVLQGDRVS